MYGNNESLKRTWYEQNLIFIIKEPLFSLFIIKNQKSRKAKLNHKTIDVYPKKPTYYTYYTHHV